MREILGIDPRSVILDGDRHSIAQASDDEPDGRRCIGVFPGVVEQVFDKLVEQRRMDKREPGTFPLEYDLKLGGSGMIGLPQFSLARPCSEVDHLTARQACLGIGPRQEEQHLDDLAEPPGMVANEPQGMLVVVGWSVSSQRDVDLADHDRERGPKLVRSVSGESLLAFKGFAEPVEQTVESVGEFFQFVRRTRRRKAVANLGDRHAARSLGHRRKRT